MKSIKEFNTKGMSLCDRYKLLEEVIPVPIGEIVYKSDFFDWTEAVEVTKENQDEVTMFWNSIYFDDKDKADQETMAAHADYFSEVFKPFF